MNGGRGAVPGDRDINTSGQLVMAMLLSVFAHAIIITAVVTFHSWSPQRKIIVPGYKVDLVTLSPGKPASLLPPGQPGPQARPAEPEKPAPAPELPKQEPKAEPKMKSAPPPMKKSKAEPTVKDKAVEAPRKIVAKSEDQPKKEPEKKEEDKKIEKAEPSPSKTPELPPLATAAIPPGPSGRTGGQSSPGASRPSSGGGGGGGVVTDGVAFPHMWYLQILERKANENWITHGIIIGGKRADPVVRFRILKNGGVEGLMLEKSSGNAALDESALAAINKATPFPPLPGDYGSDHLTVHFTFTFEQRD